MLVLTRKAEEAIVIGSRIRVTVLDVRGGKVRLGIEAPQTVPVLRHELKAAGAFDFVDLSEDESEAPVFECAR